MHVDLDMSVASMDAYGLQPYANDRLQEDSLCPPVLLSYCTTVALHGFSQR